MKTAVVTGVCGGIGRAIAERFVESGWDVVGVDAVESEVSLPLTRFVAGDVSTEALWAAVASVIGERGLHALVNNAALQICKPLLETTLEEWDRTLAINLRSAFLSIRALVPLMRGRGAGVVNVASVHAQATSRGICAYAASKGALVSFTRAAALELADDGIRVNCVLPGAVDTPMLRAGLARGGAGSEAEKLARIAHATPLGKVGRPEDIAQGVFFLVDPALSAFVTGQSLVLDGGALARLSTE